MYAAEPAIPEMGKPASRNPLLASGHDHGERVVQRNEADAHFGGCAWRSRRPDMGEPARFGGRREHIGEIAPAARQSGQEGCRLLTATSPGCGAAAGPQATAGSDRPPRQSCRPSTQRHRTTRSGARSTARREPRSRRVTAAPDWHRGDAGADLKCLPSRPLRPAAVRYATRRGCVLRRACSWDVVRQEVGGYLPLPPGARAGAWWLRPVTSAVSAWRQIRSSSPAGSTPRSSSPASPSQSA